MRQICPTDEQLMSPLRVGSLEKQTGGWGLLAGELISGASILRCIRFTQTIRDVVVHDVRSAAEHATPGPTQASIPLCTARTTDCTGLQVQRQQTCPEEPACPDPCLRTWKVSLQPQGIPPAWPPRASLLPQRSVGCIRCSPVPFLLLLKPCSEGSHDHALYVSPAASLMGWAQVCARGAVTGGG